MHDLLHDSKYTKGCHYYYYIQYIIRYISSLVQLNELVAHGRGGQHPKVRKKQGDVLCRGVIDGGVEEANVVVARDGRGNLRGSRRGVGVAVAGLFRVVAEHVRHVALRQGVHARELVALHGHVEGLLERLGHHGGGVCAHLELRLFLKVRGVGVGGGKKIRL